MKDFAHLFLVIVLAAGGGFVASEWNALKQAGAIGTEGSLRIPAELKTTVGEPAELRADTNGKRVVWMSLDNELKLRPMDSKGIWVFAAKAGTYRVTAWTSVGNLPTTNALCLVKVEEEKAEKPENEQQAKTKE